MRIAAISAVCLALATLTLPPARADGEVCTDAQKAQAESGLKKAEDAERAGRLKDAYAAIRATSSFECAANGYKRRDALLERLSRKLGEEAEKAGRYGEAFDYYRAPQSVRADYDLSDADRALLKHVKAASGDYKVVSSAASWFEQRGNPASLGETRAIARASGEEALAAEERAFAATRNSLNELGKARQWLELAGDAKAISARAAQRGDALLAHGAFSSVERAFQYYDFAGNRQKLKSAQDRARRLGDEYAKNGQTRVAAQFYELAGDSARAAALGKKNEARNEKAEGKRQQQFQKDQKSLEKELGL